MITPGDKFGGWAVLRRDPENINKWICLCDCGTEKSVYGDSLNRGDSKSCGCSRINISIGDKFGKLTVIKRTTNSDKGNTKWVCTCECGNETTVHGPSLSKGMTKSCGCLSRASNGHRSNNENLVSIALEIMEIPFEYEPFKFDLEKGSYTPDFFIPSLDLWIEVKGAKYQNMLKASEFAMTHNLLILMEEDLSILCGGESVFYLYIRGRDDMDEVRDKVRNALSNKDAKILALDTLTNWKIKTKTIIESRLESLKEEITHLTKLMEEYND